MEATNEYSLTLDEKRDLCARTDVWLDGYRAKISGAKLPFGIVSVGTVGVDYPWPCIAHIMKNGGNFTSK